jgi:hypothetical protein
MLTMDSSVPGQGPVLGCYEHGTGFPPPPQMAENFLENWAVSFWIWTLLLGVIYQSLHFKIWAFAAMVMKFAIVE